MSPIQKPISHTSNAVSASLQELLANGLWRAYDGIYSERLVSWIQHELGVEHVRLCCSGTFAVELALRGLRVHSEDEIIVSAYDFPGNFRSVEDAGAKVLLCDPCVDDGWVLTPEALSAVVATECKAVIVSHLHGQLAPMKRIMEWARACGVKVIEDACQAHGAVVDGRPAGSWGDVGIFSYGGSKLVSAGRGGAVVTNDPLIAQRMTVFCERGNNAFPLSEIQAALVLAQYEGLKRDHETRLESAKQIVESAKQFKWIQFPFDVNCNSPAFYKLGLLVGRSDPELSWESHRNLRTMVLEKLIAYGIDAGEGFRGFADRSPKRYRTQGTLQQCRILSSRTIVLHHSMLQNPNSGLESIDRVLEAMKRIDEELKS